MLQTFNIWTFNICAKFKCAQIRFKWPQTRHASIHICMLNTSIAHSFLPQLCTIVYMYMLENFLWVTSDCWKGTSNNLCIWFLITLFTVSCLSNQNPGYTTQGVGNGVLISTWNYHHYGIQTKHPWCLLTWQDWDKIAGPKSWRGRWWHTASCHPERAAASVGHHAPSCP